MCRRQEIDERWKVRLIIAQSTKALSDPQRGENHRETQELALSSRQWQSFKGFLKARSPHFYCLGPEGKKKGGQSVNAFSKGKWRHTPICTGLRVSVLKSNGMISGHPFPTKPKPWIYLRVCSLQQRFLNSWRDSKSPRVWVLGFYKAGLENDDFESKEDCPYLSTAWVVFYPEAPEVRGATGGAEATTWLPKR